MGQDQPSHACARDSKSDLRQPDVGDFAQQQWCQPAAKHERSIKKSRCDHRGGCRHASQRLRIRCYPPPESVLCADVNKEQRCQGGPGVLSTANTRLCLTAAAPRGNRLDNRRRHRRDADRHQQGKSRHCRQQERDTVTFRSCRNQERARHCSRTPAEVEQVQSRASPFGIDFRHQ